MMSASGSTQLATGNPPLPEVTGWLLDAACFALDSAGYSVCLVETGPPARRQRPEVPGKRKSSRGPGRVQEFGEWRVLRCRVLDEVEPAVELLVARELIGESRPEQSHPEQP